MIKRECANTIIKNGNCSDGDFIYCADCPFCRKECCDGSVTYSKKMAEKWLKEHPEEYTYSCRKCGKEVSFISDVTMFECLHCGEIQAVRPEPKTAKEKLCDLLTEFASRATCSAQEYRDAIYSMVEESEGLMNKSDEIGNRISEIFSTINKEEEKEVPREYTHEEIMTLFWKNNYGKWIKITAYSKGMYFSEYERGSLFNAWFTGRESATIPPEED